MAAVIFQPHQQVVQQQVVQQHVVPRRSRPWAERDGSNGVTRDTQRPDLYLVGNGGSASKISIVQILFGAWKRVQSTANVLFLVVLLGVSALALNSMIEVFGGGHRTGSASSSRLGQVDGVDFLAEAALGGSPNQADIGSVPAGNTYSDSEYYVVKPGDTLWGIATKLRPEGDVRPIVDALAERAGGVDIMVGQRLRVDGLGR